MVTTSSFVSILLIVTLRSWGSGRRRPRTRGQSTSAPGAFAWAVGLRLPTDVVESPAMSATTERRAWIFGTTAPALVFLLVIAYLPIAYAVMLSFFKKTAFNPAMKWVGLANYHFIFDEPELWNAFWRSVVFTLGAVGLQLVWGLVSALLLNRAFKGLNLVRSLFVLPYLLPSIVVALVFQWLLSQEYGVVNQVLMQTGAVARPINFFGGLGTAMWAVI